LPRSQKANRLFIQGKTVKIESFAKKLPETAATPRAAAAPAESSVFAGARLAPTLLNVMSGTASGASVEIDTARVEQVRAAIIDGTLGYNAEQIADELLETARALLGARR
jgi:flagellar biosynthesis anti-sigma factor FlgM